MRSFPSTFVKPKVHSLRTRYRYTIGWCCQDDGRKGGYAPALVNRHSSSETHLIFSVSSTHYSVIQSGGSGREVPFRNILVKPKVQLLRTRYR